MEMENFKFIVEVATTTVATASLLANLIAPNSPVGKFLHILACNFKDWNKQK